MRRFAASALALGCCVAFPSAAGGATDPAVFGPCLPYPSDAPAQQICSAQVLSFDGAPLDVDLTPPAQGTGTIHPLIVMLHGFGNDKREWESLTDDGDSADKWHWNSHWLSRHGYYVLTYTARGFRTKQSPERADQPETPPFTSEDRAANGTIHLKSREFEIRDTQWLAALVADAFPDVDQHAIAVTGGSYGGGESWLQASQRRWTFPADCSRGATEQCPLARPEGELPVLDLQVAVPKYPWTDLAYSLSPNGHPGGPNHDDLYESSQGTPDAGAPSAGTPTANPSGVPKLSYLNGFYALGQERGSFEEGQGRSGPEECQYSTTAWHTRVVVAGDPYDSVLPPPPPTCQREPLPTPPPAADNAQVRRGLTKFRSAYYQDENWAEQCGPGFNFEPTDVCDPDERKVAIFSISGWTDDLFPPIESFRMFKYLKRLDPMWPVAVGTADVGHPRAQNKPEVWQRMNNQAWQFLEANINGSHDQETTVYSEPTICPGEPAFTSAQQLTATTPEGLSQGTLVMGAIRSGSTNSPGSGGFDLAGPRTDPVLGTPGCASSPHEPPQTAGKYVAYSQPLKSSSIYVGLGHVTLPNAVVSGHTATLNVRVFVEKPPGQQDLLVTRGTYRYFIPPEDAVPAPARDIKIPLFGNHRDLDPGDVLRLDVTQVDHPFLRPSNEPTETTFGPPRLTLTTREAGFTFVPGT